MSLVLRLIAVGCAFAAIGCLDLESGSTADLFSGSKSNEAEIRDVWNECLPPLDEGGLDKALFFDGMKTGDECDFQSGCGYVEDIPSMVERLLFQREARCVGNRLKMVNTWLGGEDAPRTDVLWEDCAAMADGRTGETCDGSFSCFSTAGDACLETVSCSEFSDTQMVGKLIRYQLCDDIGEAVSQSTDDVVSDCSGVENARPLNRCDGVFLCARYADNPQFSEVPDCTEDDGYCLIDAPGPGNLNGDLAWCDGETLHLATVHDSSIVSYHVGRAL